METSMAFHIKNVETDALARKVAALKKVGLTEAVHAALLHELEREQGRPSTVELGLQFARDLRATGDPARGQPVDKAFRDSLYEDE
jgi:antitoxin VapB